MSYNKEDIKRRMEGAVDALKHEFSGLRTGRASTAMLDTITVEVYGSRMPLSQVGSISVPEPRLLTVQVWDNGTVKAVEKAIRDANLGLNPAPDGNLIRIPVPELNQDRRKELVKVAGGYAESGRVAIRNIRRDGMEGLKKLKADGQSEDENKRQGEEVQKLTDEYVKKIDTMLADKEKDIMTV
jgi:ribosome recycling factor